ncbi:putative O-succinylbenzoate-CoA ligase domain protein, partial [Bacteroides fragilis str. 3986T(B)10]
MAGLQVFFQAFANKNALINVFNKNRVEVYELLSEYHVTHISATPTFY